MTHEEKYRKMRKDRGVKLTIKSLKHFGVDSIQELQRLYNKDKNLNNIPLKTFDIMTGMHNVYTRSRHNNITLAEGCCMYKQALTDLLDSEEAKQAMAADKIVGGNDYGSGVKKL